MTSSINSLGPDLPRYTIDRFINPRDWENLRWVNKECNNKVFECAAGRMTQWQHGDIPFSIPNEIAHLPPMRQVQSLYESIVDVRDRSEIRGDVLANVPRAMRIQQKSLIQLIQILQERIPEIAWPVIQGDDLLTDAEMIREWMDTNQDIVNEIISLDLSNCDISILPPEINRFSHLRALSLNNTHIISLPKGFNPQSLEWLDLSNTPITSLPKGFNPQNLRNLFLLGTSITSLPEGFNPPHLHWSDYLTSLQAPLGCILL